MRIGLDVGSTTLKCIVLDDTDKIIYKSYERHYSQIVEKSSELLHRIAAEIFGGKEVPCNICISGSAGMGFAERAGIPFAQEVYATKIAVDRVIPGTDIVIELGGEDAKILFLTNGLEVRMNGSCAGGTGAFIDQMATLLSTTPDEMNELAKEHEKIYTIASRCGVFAKSDIQPLINQGARIQDISASILYAVVNQTVAGLAQGREIKGKVAYLGGPLTFFSELRRSFDKTLGLEGVFPENSLYFVAMGAALLSDSENKKMTLTEACNAIDNSGIGAGYASVPPLFTSEDDYNEFKARHDSASIPTLDPENYSGDAYLGIDAGSTTIKAVVLDENENILLTSYQPNSGNPVPLIREFLTDMYERYPGIKIKSAGVTGYGEEIIKNAFKCDTGIVETMAHFTAAKKFMPEVDFIIDIGGQDIKCFKIRNGAIDNIFLNEACSSGCGSFLQTFAGALNYSIADFAKLGLYADRPVDLGSRCTVFMNSSVKQAQKDGASIENISAGLSVSVVKNALYKVIRAPAGDATLSLGKNIVVQGGTFLNDAVLRAFEQEIGANVIRPTIAGLMGAYGVALYAKSNAKESSTIITKEELQNFRHDVKAVTCGLCSNHCRLTVNTFEGGRKFIGGNRCERPISGKVAKERINMYEYKLELLEKYMNSEAHPGASKRGAIGLPLGLNMYELLPFWHKFFTELGFEVVTSPFSTRKIYLKGQQTIPSDTVCYPAKLLHGHLEWLVDTGIKNIFYPCMTYNVDEGLGDNNYNCPVVAYYPEVISANVHSLNDVNFMYPYIGIHRPKDLPVKLAEHLAKHFDDIRVSDVKQAIKLAFDEYASHMRSLREYGENAIKRAKELGMPIIILAGRPYHVDPEINHGIDRLICDCGAAVITEDSVSSNMTKFKTHVLNQWTYHSRMYAAAKYIADKPEMNLVQLVSFGCGVDAITTDEVRAILEHEGKIYTQIKIDEITNLGAVKIRLRSLFAAAYNSN